MKIRYEILQANLTQSGNGDYWSEGVFNTFEEALERALNIYNDDSDLYTRYPYGILETQIQEQYFNEDEEMTDFEVVEVWQKEYKWR